MKCVGTKILFILNHISLVAMGDGIVISLDINSSYFESHPLEKYFWKQKYFPFGKVLRAVHSQHLLPVEKHRSSNIMSNYTFLLFISHPISHSSREHYTVKRFVWRMVTVITSSILLVPCYTFHLFYILFTNRVIHFHETIFTYNACLWCVIKKLRIDFHRRKRVQNVTLCMVWCVKCWHGNDWIGIEARKTSERGKDVKKAMTDGRYRRKFGIILVTFIYGEIAVLIIINNTHLNYGWY